MKTSLLGKKSSDIWNNRAPHPFLPLHDMKIEVLLDNMSNGDSFIYDCCKKVFEHYNTNIGIIQYRQEVLKDFIANNKLVTDMTNILDFVYNMQFSYHSYELIVDNPTAIISFSQKQIIQYVLGLQKLKYLLEKHQEKIHSEALRELILELNQNVSDTYVNELLSFVKCVDNLDELEMNVKLATGYKLTGFKLSHKKKRWDRIQKIKFDKNDFASVSLLNDLKQNMLQETANVLAHTADQLHKYIQNLRREMAFFQGCVSLHKKLSKFGISTCFPDVCPIYEHKMEFTELGDVALALSKREKVVTNSFNLTNQNLVIITGANQGGKSTFI